MVDGGDRVDVALDDDLRRQGRGLDLEDLSLSKEGPRTFQEIGAHAEVLQGSGGAKVVFPPVRPTPVSIAPVRLARRAQYTRLSACRS